MNGLMVGMTGVASTPPTLSLLPTATQHNPNKPYEHSDPKDPVKGGAPPGGGKGGDAARSAINFPIIVYGPVGFALFPKASKAANASALRTSAHL